MKDKVKLFVVSHSHWDREWYFSQSKHNYNLVHFMDDLINLLENDDKFNSFHLDGQILILEDYLQIRPNMKDRICKLIKNNKLKIGPFFILQDDYLISGEANIRNIIVGLKKAEKYGKPTLVGYFPDTFGNISQMPQILNGFGIDNVFIGRGPIITSMPFDNEKRGKTDDGFAEINWVSPDNSEVIAIQFLWWYSNGKELPVDKKQLKDKLDWLIDNMAYSQKTPYLLIANGCDHQPVQKNISNVINVAKELGYDICHTSYESFIDKIRPFKNSFGKYYGEIDSQYGNGFRTLRETASSRIYLKQLSYKAEYLLSGVLEPLSVVADINKIKYDYDIIFYCWEKLLENYAHDSICGCSVDEVHKEMEVRFSSLLDTINSHIDYLGSKLVSNFAYDNESILVVNCYPKEISDYVSCNVDFIIDENNTTDNGLYVDNSNAKCIEKDDFIRPEFLTLIDENGKEYECSFNYLGKVQTFTLPEDSFRKVFYVHRYSVCLYGIFKPLSISKLKIVNKKSINQSCISFGSFYAENEFIKISFNKNGSFNILNKSNNFLLSNQNYFSEIGDKGNEYEFFECGKMHNTLLDDAKISIKNYNQYQVTFTVVNSLLQQNNKYVYITSEITLKAHKKGVFVNVFFDNCCENHRIRSVFDFLNSDIFHYSSGQFDLVKRFNKPNEKWEKNSNPLRAYEFVQRVDKNKNGVIIALTGNNEYEINSLGGTELTLVRGTGILGDWFPFYTKESQCLRKVEASYYIEDFSYETSDFTICDAFDYHKPKLIAFSGRGKNNLINTLPYIKNGDVIITCVKKNDKNETIIRLFNPYSKEKKIIFSNSVNLVSMDEKNILDKNISFVIPPKKIFTFII